MENSNLIKEITSYLKPNEIYPELLFLNKKLYKTLYPCLEKKIEENKEYWTKVKEKYIIRKFNMQYSVQLITYGYSLLVHTRGQELEFVFIDVAGFPIYPCHRVGARFTRDNWNSFQDVDGRWLYNKDGKEIWKIDIWNFELDIYKDFIFCIYGLDVNGHYSWDNNSGKNYILKRNK